MAEYIINTVDVNISVYVKKYSYCKDNKDNQWNYQFVITQILYYSNECTVHILTKNSETVIVIYHTTCMLQLYKSITDVLISINS